MKKPVSKFQSLADRLIIETTYQGAYTPTQDDIARLRETYLYKRILLGLAVEELKNNIKKAFGF